jgi:hypothetical protein
MADIEVAQAIPHWKGGVGFLTGAFADPCTVDC